MVLSNFVSNPISSRSKGFPIRHVSKGFEELRRILGGFMVNLWVNMS